MKAKLGRRFRFAINKSTIKINLRLFGFHFYTIMSMHPRVHTMGITNLLLDDQLVFFGDWDNVFLYRVRKEVCKLQRRYDIGSVAIISSGEDIDDQGKAYGNFHAVGIGKLRYHEVFRMLEETSVDRNFVRVPDYFNGRYHVLRIAPKYSDGWDELRDRPVLREVIVAKTRRECSRGMYDFLRKHYDFPELTGEFKPRFDDLRNVRLINYQTTHGGWWNELKRVLTFGRKDRVLNLRNQEMNMEAGGGEYESANKST